MTEKSNANKWLIGCGIGCGGLILVVLILIGIGYFLLRDTVTGFKDVEATMTELVDTYGEVYDFTPDPVNPISEERVRIFLAVRDSIAWDRQELENALNSMTSRIDELESGKKGFWEVVGVMRKGFGFVPMIAGYYGSRNEALLRSGMGIGEYYYIYVHAFYSYLGKNPEDGPDFTLVGEESRDWQWSKSEDGENEEEEKKRREDVFEKRREQIMDEIRRFLVPMMERQADRIGGSSSWKRSLQQEIRAIDTYRGRIPWENGLPVRFTRSLAPFRDRLEASYSATLNPLELQAFSE